MTTPKPTDAANLKVDFSFDDWEREVEVKPFVIAIGGKPYTAVDIAEIDFREFNLAANSDDEAALFEVLFPKDHEKILSAKLIKLGALGDFSRRVLKHYGLDPTAA